jgi:hypothetical protein
MKQLYAVSIRIEHIWDNMIFLWIFSFQNPGILYERLRSADRMLYFFTREKLRQRKCEISFSYPLLKTFELFASSRLKRLGLLHLD